MPWKSKPKYHAPSSSSSISTYASTTDTLGMQHVLLALLYLTLLVAVLSSIPLLILLTPKPELGTQFPANVKCATCEEIEGQNPVLLEGVGCRGGRDENGSGVVTFKGMERCWVGEEGRDGWLRPVGWTREDVVRWMEEQRKGEGE